jgi:UDP-N-acetylglucosamine 2-epimerase (non-hydrolysing)
MLKENPDNFETVVCVTAQHREMLDQVLSMFDISPNHDLDLMRKGQSPAQVAGTIFQKLPAILENVQPGVVLVQGDTITTFAAAMCSYLQRIPVGHIEAGLRTGNLNHPFPEEMNRRLTTQVSQLHFAPTERAAHALLTEGVPHDNIFVTGNTVIDALMQTVNREHRFVDKRLNQILTERQMILVTTHRRESFGAPLQSICRAVKRIAASRNDIDIVLPVHPNPNVSDTVHSILGDCKNVKLIEPLEYRDFVNLMARATLILTDSGGIQEEAPSLDIPVLVLRETTERPEGIDAGATRMVGTDEDRIVENAINLLSNQSDYDRMAAAPNPYGDGTASQKIAEILLNRFNH